MSAPTAPCHRVSVANDYQIVIAGLHAMLAPFEDRVKVVEWIDVNEDTPERWVDVLLFDTFGRVGLGLDLIHELVSNPVVDHVVVYTWETDESLIDRASTLGVAGFVSKSLEPVELLDVFDRVVGGEHVVSVGTRRTRLDPAPDWPGMAMGLTQRESETLALVVRGLRNQEIADALFLGVNTVKTHLKSLYRKLGARNRAEAVALALADGTFRATSIAEHS
jgi:DNA-binding NarL/FixJ family response regulator